MGSLQTAEWFLTVLDAASPKSGCQHAGVLMGAGLLTFCCILRAERASQLSSLFHRGMDPTRGLHLHELPASKYLTALGCFPLWISEPYLHPLAEANPSSGSCSPFVPLEKEQELLPVSPGGSSEAASMVSSNHSALQDRGWHPASVGPSP